MLRSMNSAISGMQSFETMLDVVGNNISNVDTPGFKASTADFSNVMSQTLNGGNALGPLKVEPTRNKLDLVRR